MKIGITYNLKNELQLDDEFLEEFDCENTIDSICQVLNKNAYGTIKLGGGIDIVDKIKKHKVDFVWNIAEGYLGRSRESQIPAILEMLNLPYSGSDPLTLGLALDKDLAKRIAIHSGVPTPDYRVIKTPAVFSTVKDKLDYPLIVKPLWEGSSKGIYNSSKVFTEKSLENNINYLFQQYESQPVLVEEYIEGQEITVGIIGNDNPCILGVMEIANKGAGKNDFFYSLETKRDWRNLVNYILPAEISESVDRQIREYAVILFKRFGCRDLARVDFKVSKKGRVFFLEINPLPGLSPEYSDLVIMSGKVGITYEELIIKIVDQAFLRYNLIGNGKAPLKNYCFKK